MKFLKRYHYLVHYLNFSLPLLLVLFLYELSSSFNKGFHFYQHNIQYVFVWRILLKCLYNQIFANNFLRDNLSSTEKNLIFRNVQMWVTSNFCLYHPLFLLAPPAIQENELVSPSNSQIALYIPPGSPSLIISDSELLCTAYRTSKGSNLSQSWLAHQWFFCHSWTLHTSFSCADLFTESICLDVVPLQAL